MITYMFPGQGSQVKGMGKTLFEEYPEIIKKADEILEYSIRELCLEDSDNSLNLTQYTQPALYIINALAYFQRKDKKPDFVIGHSLGEYNALLAAQVFDFETGLKLVKKRGELMGRASGGAMAAVIKLNEERIRDILDKYRFDGIDIANFNTAEQTVISGKIEDIDAVKSIFEKEGATFIRLNTSAAFHSRYMVEAKEEFKQYLKNFRFAPPQIPLISNVTARPYEVEEIKQNIVNQLCAPVRWADSIQYILNQGCQDFEELGPGQVLTKLVAAIKKQPSVITISKLHTDNCRSYQEICDEAQKKVTEWNSLHMIGTEIRCRGYSETLITRTNAVVLFGHRAAVYVENYNGYFDLDEILSLYEQQVN